VSPTRTETVIDTMTRDVVTIIETSDVRQLESLMIEKKVHGVPVVDGAGRLVGVVSQTDVLAWHLRSGVRGVPFYDEAERAGEQALPLETGPAEREAVRVSDIMSPLVYCISEDRPVDEAAAMMIQRWIHRLVVVDDDLHVRGVVSAIDLLHCLPGVAEALRRVTTNSS